MFAACSASTDDNGDGGDVSSEPDSSTVSVPTDQPDVAKSVVRVVTTGTFVSPDFGQLDSVGGSGSAFIISDSGLAVTNNHVVAGAATVEVFFDGSDDVIPAVVVARSECSDLAVIDLAGDGYSQLDWVDDAEVEVGREVRAAGFPLGDPQLTLTAGIVARIDDDGATPWASIPSLLRHDADLEPGNSGGPIVDAASGVVGVNVAASDSGRYAIPSTVAAPIVEQLVTGVDVDSIGLNAVAVLDDVTNESGVWVVSVEAGSPASVAGVEPGDVITRMKGVRVGKDATLADYCAVIRSAGDGELPIEVARNGEFLAGSLRGASLSPVLMVANDVSETASNPPPAITTPPPAGTPYVAFDNVTDDSGTISVDVPTEWSDRRTAPVFIGDFDRPAIAASTDVDALDAAAGTTYDQAGVAVAVFSAEVPIEEAFDGVVGISPWMFDCIPLDREPFDDGTYAGVVQGFMQCAGGSSTVFSIALRRADQSGWVLMNIFAPTVADLDAAIRIAETLEIRPGTSVPVDPIPAPDATDDIVESSPELPGTVASTDDMIAAVGIPPAAGQSTATVPEEGFLQVTYPTTASVDQLRQWAESRLVELGCGSKFESESSEGEFDFYSVNCDYERDGDVFTYTIRVYGAGGDNDVEVVAIDWRE